VNKGFLLVPKDISIVTETGDIGSHVGQEAPGAFKYQAADHNINSSEARNLKDQATLFLALPLQTSLTAQITTRYVQQCTNSKEVSLIGR
jgi:hypothetical protein